MLSIFYSGIRNLVLVLRAALCPEPRIVRETTNSQGKWVALTFDDGPHPTYTPQVLAILKQHNIHATFCLIGEMVQRNPELVRRIVAEGHRLCNHTMTHDEHLPSKSSAHIEWDVKSGLDEIRKAVPGAEVPYFRAPWGNFTSRVDRIAAKFGHTPLGWSVDTRDWSTPGVSAIIDAVIRDLKPGGVILMHDAGDDRSQTVTAVEQLIPMLIAQGYQFDFPATR